MKSNQLAWLVLLGIISLTLWSYRWIFFQKIDTDYLEDYYYHSQWVIPQSSRIMSDNELYQFAGHKILQGLHSFEIVPEAPPLGKYLYGLSIYYFSSFYPVSIFFYFASLIVFFLILRKTCDKFFAIIGTALLASSSLFALQISRTMFDLPQLFFFLSHILSILYLSTEKKTFRKIIFALLAGLALGFMAAVKLPIFIPLILLIDIIFLWYQKNWKYFFITIFVSAISYISCYFRFFVLGNSIVAWLKAEKWVFNFYMLPSTASNKFMFLVSSLTGYFKGWWKEPWTRSETWSLIWPITIVSGIVYWIKRRKNKQFNDGVTIYLATLFTAISLVYLIIPFWPRYYLLILPLGIYLLIKLLSHRVKLLLSILVVSVFELLVFTYSPFDRSAQFIQHNWEQANYEELYQSLSYGDQNEIDVFTFARIMDKLDKQKQLSERRVQLGNRKDSQSQIFEKIPIGELKIECSLPIIKEHNRWKLDWNWECIAKDFELGDSLQLDIQEVPAGKMLTQTGVLVSTPGLQSVIILDKTKIENFQKDKLFHEISDLTGISTIGLENLLYVRNSWTDQVDLGLLLPNYNETLFDEVSQDPAVIISQREGRLYTDKVAREMWPYLANLEQLHHDDLLAKLGGQLLLINASGVQKQIIFDSQSISGEDVILDKSELDLGER